jgi:hypothetical protein
VTLCATMYHLYSPCTCGKLDTFITMGSRGYSNGRCFANLALNGMWLIQERSLPDWLLTPSPTGVDMLDRLLIIEVNHACNSSPTNRECGEPHVESCALHRSRCASWRIGGLFERQPVSVLRPALVVLTCFIALESRPCTECTWGSATNPIGAWTETEKRAF